MRFSLSLVLLMFLLVALALKVFGFYGIIVAGVLVCILVYARRVRSGWKAMVHVGSVSLVAALVLLYFSFVFDARRPHPGAWCVLHLHQIGMALRQYELLYGAIPAAQVQESAGQPLCSWRIALLPSLGRSDLYHQYDPGQPWNSPNNVLIAAMPDTYVCPKESMRQRDARTSYVAVLGADGGWLKAESSNERASNPVRVAEIADSNVTWTEPQDITLDEYCKWVSAPSGARIFLRHECNDGIFHSTRPPGVHALFADGTVRAIRPNVPMDVLRGALLGDPKKQEELDRLCASALNWGKCAAFGMLVLLFARMLMRERVGEPVGREKRKHH